MTKILAVLFSITLLFLSSHASAQWRTKSGEAIPESNHVKSANGFNAMLLMTPDPNWMDEWNTPSIYDPQFTTASEVSLGGQLNILAILSNPGLDSEKLANVSCDFSVQRPDGSYSIDQKDMECFKTKLEGDPNNLYMTSATLKFISEESDQKGTYKVSVNLHDKIRGVSLTVSDSFINK